MSTFNARDPFADAALLEDADEWNGSREAPAPTNNPHVEDIGNVAIPGFVEDCQKCRGTGTYYGYSRHGRHCFKCKGTGKLQFKTSPEARAKSRKSAAKRKVKAAEATAAAFDQWLDTECPDVAQWLRENASRGDGFALSLVAGGKKYGHLTDGQVAGVRKCIAKDADSAAGAGEFIAAHKAEHEWLVREAAAGNEFADSLLNGQCGLMKRGLLSDNQLNAIRRNLSTDSPATASEIDLSGLELGRAGSAWRSYFAVPNGDTRLKLCIRRPGKNSRYYGWTFVDDGAEYGSRRTYGKQAPDGLYKGDVQDALQAILKDPLEAAVAYGKLVGVCGVCGRALEDEESVAAGIGPVCASKFG